MSKETKIKLNQIEGISKVAGSGDYNDLNNKPNISNSTITIKQGGETKGSFTLNQDGDTTINLDSGGGSGGTSNYDDLENKPKINNVELNGNKSAEDLDLQEKITKDNKLDIALIDGEKEFIVTPEIFEKYKVKYWNHDLPDGSTRYVIHTFRMLDEEYDNIQENNNIVNFNGYEAFLDGIFGENHYGNSTFKDGSMVFKNGTMYLDNPGYQNGNSSIIGHGDTPDPEGTENGCGCAFFMKNFDLTFKDFIIEAPFSEPWDEGIISVNYDSTLTLLNCKINGKFGKHGDMALIGLNEKWDPYEEYEQDFDYGTPKVGTDGPATVELYEDSMRRWSDTLNIIKIYIPNVTGTDDFVRIQVFNTDNNEEILNMTIDDEEQHWWDHENLPDNRQVYFIHPDNFFNCNSESYNVRVILSHNDQEVINFTGTINFVDKYPDFEPEEKGSKFTVMNSTINIQPMELDDPEEGNNATFGFLSINSNENNVLMNNNIVTIENYYSNNPDDSTLFFVRTENYKDVNRIKLSNNNVKINGNSDKRVLDLNLENIGYSEFSNNSFGGNIKLRDESNNNILEKEFPLILNKGNGTWDAEEHIEVDENRSLPEFKLIDVEKFKESIGNEKGYYEFLIEEDEDAGEKGWIVHGPNYDSDGFVDLSDYGVEFDGDIEDFEAFKDGGFINYSIDCKEFYTNPRDEEIEVTSLDDEGDSTSFYSLIEDGKLEEGSLKIGYFCNNSYEDIEGREYCFESSGIISVKGININGKTHYDLDDNNHLPDDDTLNDGDMLIRQNGKWVKVSLVDLKAKLDALNN